jgi:periplasmic protein TonB
MSETLPAAFVSFAAEPEECCEVRRAVLWSAAALVAFVAHAGAVVWALYEPPIEMADNASPPAIMIELSAEPEAINTTENEISPDEINAEASTPQTEQRAETPRPEDVVEPTEQAKVKASFELSPDRTEPAPEIAPVEQPTMAPVENVEVSLPAVQPPQAEEVKPREKPTPRQVAKKAPPQQQASTASQAKSEAAAQVKQSNRNAASRPIAALGFGSVSPAKWQARLMAHLERRKKYPSGARSRREQGVAYVQFRIDASGNVLSASLARSSGFRELDAEVVALVKRASPVPAPPPDVNKTITAPMRFDLR